MNPLPKNRTINIIALHLLVWGILFAFPLLFSGGDFPKANLYLRTVLPLVFIILIFYLNYFVLIEKVLFKNQVVLFIFLNLALIALFMWGEDWVRDLIPRNNAVPRPPSRGPISSGFRSFYHFRAAFSMALTVAVSVAISITERWLKSEAARKSMETEQLKSTLSHLQYQIQPHFFFNSLNNIYSLVDSAPEKAKDSIHRLSKLMRYTLHDATAEQVALANEIAFLKNYIDLMRLRLTDKVAVQYDFPQDADHTLIAPLLFIPLVENAFKHGVSASQASFIFIKMRIENKRLFFWVENTNFPKDERDKGGSGIGVENLQKRLRLLYPNRHEFQQEVQDGIFRVDLVIDLNV
ncbi:MAG: histidine kinase [Saprospiraceae bacterium]|nr:histidine kinase [Saprospiraceae bacterium]